MAVGFTTHVRVQSLAASFAAALRRKPASLLHARVQCWAGLVLRAAVAIADRLGGYTARPPLHISLLHFQALPRMQFATVHKLRPLTLLLHSACPGDNMSWLFCQAPVPGKAMQRHPAALALAAHPAESVHPKSGSHRYQRVIYTASVALAGRPRRASTPWRSARARSRTRRRGTCGCPCSSPGTPRERVGRWVRRAAAGGSSTRRCWGCRPTSAWADAATNQAQRQLQCRITDSWPADDKGVRTVVAP